MKRLTNPDELRLFRDSVRADKQANTRTVWVCGGTGCLAWGSAAVLEALKELSPKKDSTQRSNSAASPQDATVSANEAR